MEQYKCQLCETTSALFGLISAILFLNGCAHQQVPMPNDPRYAPVHQTQLVPPNTTTGSLYHPGYATNIWEDQRARRVGDVITIVLQEETSSSKSNNTNIKKDSSLESPSMTLLGTTPSLKASKLLPSSSSLTLNNDASTEREFSGQADTDQSNSLEGSITVTVSEVLPNGLLKVRGEKWLALSRGEEFIRITGMIRAADINADNTVRSTRVADARITYSGTGALAEANQVGWLYRFFNHPLWPF